MANAIQASRSQEQGVCAAERMEELNVRDLIINIINTIANMELATVQLVNVIAMIENLVEKAIAIRTIVWHPTDPIDRTNSNRGVDTFTSNECWHFFRFRKQDLPRLLIALYLPNVEEVKGTKKLLLY